MAYIDIIKNVKLLEKSILRLEVMGEAKPKTLAKLKHALQPLVDKPVVSIAEPFSVLNELKQVYGDVQVNIQYSTTHKLDVNKFAKSVHSKIKQKAKVANGIVVPVQKDDSQNILVSAMKKWVEETLKQVEKKKLSLTPEEFEKQFMAKYVEANSDQDVANDIVKNLKATGYITTTNETATDTDTVQYNFPSGFTLACMKWILNKYQKSAKSSEGPPEQKPLSTAIRSVNRHIVKLSKALNGEIDAQMLKDLEKNRINSGVNVLHKTKRKARRSRWDSLSGSFSRTPSSSRSRSRSPRSRSSSLSSGSSSRSSSRSPQRREVKDSLSADQKRGIIDRLIGQVQGLALDTATFLQDSLASLCQGMEKLAVSDLRLIPHDLRLESIYALLEIGKMGNNRPKTVKALKNAIKPACRIYGLVDVTDLFSFTENTVAETDSGPLKRKLRPRQRGNKKVTHIIVGRESKVKPLSVNTFAPFMPEKKTIAFIAHKNTGYRGNRRRNSVQSRLGTGISAQTITDKYNEECKKLVELVRKRSDKQAQYWSSCVVLGDKEQVAAAAGDIYRWLHADQQNYMQCDGEDVAARQLKTLKNREQLLQGIAERCVMCKNKVNVDQLVRRMEADGYFVSPDGTAVTYPEEQNAKLLYKTAAENYDSIITDSVCNYSAEAEVAAEAMAAALKKEKEQAEMDKKKKDAAKNVKTTDKRAPRPRGWKKARLY